MAQKSKLIVLEGLDGCGKSTQFDLISEQYFYNKKIDFKAISFPDYKEKSSVLVKMYLDGEIADSADKINAYAASSFYAVDRYASFKKFWEKDYNNGKLILAARYVTSNCIYQMTKLPEKDWDYYIKWLEDYEYEKLGLPRPDLVIFLDMPVEISQKLISGRYNGDESKKDIHEADVRFLENCRKAALFTAKKQDWKIINCSNGSEPKSIESIYNEIVSVIDKLEVE